jgi:hypothetical protein
LPPGIVVDGAWLPDGAGVVVVAAPDALGAVLLGESVLLLGCEGDWAVGADVAGDVADGAGVEDGAWVEDVSVDGACVDGAGAAVCAQPAVTASPTIRPTSIRAKNVFMGHLRASAIVQWQCQPRVPARPVAATDG